MSQQDPQVTRVLIERSDGTYIELDTPEACASWKRMADAQAFSAWNHGLRAPELPWKTGLVADRVRDACTAVAAWVHARAMEYHEKAERETDPRKADFNSVIHDALLYVAEDVRRGEHLK